MNPQILYQQQNHPSFRIKHQQIKNKSQQVGHYKIGQMIGRGGFAKVYKALQIHTKTQVAVKIVKLDNLSHKDMEHLQRQIEIHKKLNHPNIVRIYQAIWTENRVFIFMELIKGQELFEHVKKHGPVCQTNAAKIFYQIVMTAKYLHAHGIAHRDIKTQNIIIDQNFNAKLIDFGLAKSFDASASGFLETFCGSPSYTAPQLLERRSYNGPLVDIWCLGVTLYVLLEACLPFDNSDNRSREVNIQSLNWHNPIYSSEQAIEIYETIFTKEYKRISIEKLLDLDFFKKNHLVFSPIGQNSNNPEEQKPINSFVVDKVSKILSKPYEDVLNAVQNHILGQSHSLYHICLHKREANEIEHHKYRSKSDFKRIEHSRSKMSTIDHLEPLTDKISSKSRPHSPHNSNIIKVLPVLEDFKRNHDSKKHLKVHIDHSQDKYHTNHTNLRDKFDIAKDSLKIKINPKYKNLFHKDLEIQVLPKPRLREDSPDSPKRILDCVKRYN